MSNNKKPILAEEVKLNKKIGEDILEAWINMLWLRPATALQKALEAKFHTKFLPFKRPIADLGCGDGTHSSLIAGRRYNSTFDMYLSIAPMLNNLTLSKNKKVHFKKANTTGDYFSGGDPYLYFNAKNYKNLINIRKKENFNFDWGCDLSPELVNKAKILDIYDDLRVQDLNKRLPLPSSSFSTIYSNVSYWMKDKRLLFSEQERILKNDGISIMTAQDPIIHNEIALTSIARKYSKFLKHSFDPEWLKQLNRGRIEQTKGLLLTVTEWKKLFNNCGLEILFLGKFMSRDAYWHYDTDLRETFPSDVTLAQDLSNSGKKGNELRKNWKKNRVDHFKIKWSSFFYDNKNWQKKIPRSWNYFVIKKKGFKSWIE